MNPLPEYASIERWVLKCSRRYGALVKHLDADDRDQEARLAAMLAIPKHDPSRGGVLTLVQSAIRHRFIDLNKAEFGQKTAPKPRPELVWLDASLGMDGSLNHELFGRPAQQEDIVDAKRVTSRKLSELPERHQRMLWMHALGWTQREIAPEVGVSAVRVGQVIRKHTAGARAPNGATT